MELTDALTGLGNRGALAGRLEEVLPIAEPKPVLRTGRRQDFHTVFRRLGDGSPQSGLTLAVT